MRIYIYNALVGRALQDLTWKGEKENEQWKSGAQIPIVLRDLPVSLEHGLCGLFWEPEAEAWSWTSFQSLKYKDPLQFWSLFHKSWHSLYWNRQEQVK